MLYLKDDTLNFNFSETVHNEARCRIDFKRTLRIPDDNNSYPLPPSLGRFVLRIERYCWCSIFIFNFIFANQIYIFSSI